MTLSSNLVILTAKAGFGIFDEVRVEFLQEIYSKHNSLSFRKNSWLRRTARKYVFGKVCEARKQSFEQVCFKV